MGTSWEGGEYASQFGKAASFYPAKVEIIDRHPDKRPSDGAWDVVTRGKAYVEVLAIRGLGVLYLTMEGVPESTRLQPVGCLTYTDQMMQFGLEAEEK